MASHPNPDDTPLAARTPLNDALKRPLHDLRISLLDRCNFRCPYCMPENEFHDGYEFLTRRDRLTHEEILHVARVATGLGVSKLRLTGGEPLLDKQVTSLVEQLAVMERRLRSGHPPPARARPRHSITEELTERELAVLRLLPGRMTQREIGDALYISMNTVKTHIRSIFRKLSASTRDEAVENARSAGFL